MNIRKKAAIMIRSLMRQLRISDHIISPIDEPGQSISSSKLLEALEGPSVGDGTPDAALFIAEEAFRAGWAALEDAQGVQVETPSKTVDEAWDAFEPSEMARDLS